MCLLTSFLPISSYILCFQIRLLLKYSQAYCSFALRELRSLVSMLHLLFSMKTIYGYLLIPLRSLLIIIMDWLFKRHDSAFFFLDISIADILIYTKIYI